MNSSVLNITISPTSKVYYFMDTPAIKFLRIKQIIARRGRSNNDVIIESVVGKGFGNSARKLIFPHTKLCTIFRDFPCLPSPV